MKWFVDCAVRFLLASCLISSMVNSQGNNVDCPHGCDSEKCQCSEDETGENLLIICDGLTGSFISCLADNVIEFQLHNSNLTALAPSDFRNDTKLEKLEITGNLKLEKIEERTFGELRNLKHLFLDGNALRSFERSIFPTFAVLEEIRLSNNKIENIRHESVFAGLENSLRELRLDHNHLKEFICPRLNKLSKLDLSVNRLRPLSKEMFRHCPNLGEINLSSNLIRDLTVNWTLLRALHTLDLTDNEIKEVEKDFHSSLHHLRYLEFNFNDLRRIPPLPRNLLWLRMSGNHFETIHNYTFENLTHLAFIQLSDCPDLTTIEEHAFAGLRNLGGLVLSYNRKLSSLPPNPWPDSRDLEVLRLESNNISIFRRSLFEELDSLWRVEINGNPIHCSCDNSWIRVEMDNEDYGWMKLWKNGSQAVICQTPDNLEGFLVSELNSYDLTCSLSRMVEHSLTTTIDGVILQAVLVEGVPSTSWYFPDGRRVYAHRQKGGRLEDDPKMEEILWDNLTIHARLTLTNSGQSGYLPGQYILEWTNAAGSDNYTFTVGKTTGAPPPHGGGTNAAAIAVTILSIGMVALFVVGGLFLYRYLRLRQLNSIQPVEEDNENVSSSEVHIQNEPEGSSLLTPVAGYGSMVA